MFITVLIYQAQMKCEGPIEVEPVEDADVEYLDDEIEFGDGDGMYVSLTTSL